MQIKYTIGGGGFCTLLFLIFLAAKLFGKITLSWWWVTCPLWIGFAGFIAVMVIYFLILLLSAIVLFFIGKYQKYR